MSSRSFFVFEAKDFKSRFSIKSLTSGEIKFLSFNIWSGKESRDNKPFVLIREYLSKMILCARHEAPEQKLLFESSFYSLLHAIIQHFPPKEIQSAAFMVNQKKLDAINKMIKYINKNTPTLKA